ncbi:serine/threonine-protein phosphatase 5 [Senna tora]|uniref:Serine/threonine-protein phosphatase 5 n=1 Tax=Senna tora TaxID=362788 RepID=A0A834W6U5_9FABA|nr:serine/threonine-protein phosphatase 5 [Senna tora]
MKGEGETTTYPCFGNTKLFFISLLPPLRFVEFYCGLFMRLLFFVTPCYFFYIVLCCCNLCVLLLYSGDALLRVLEFYPVDGVDNSLYVISCLKLKGYYKRGAAHLAMGKYMEALKDFK